MPESTSGPSACITFFCYTSLPFNGSEENPITRPGVRVVISLDLFGPLRAEGTTY